MYSERKNVVERKTWTHVFKSALHFKIKGEKASVASVTYLSYSLGDAAMQELEVTVIFPVIVVHRVDFIVVMACHDHLAHVVFLTGSHNHVGKSVDSAEITADIWFHVVPKSHIMIRKNIPFFAAGASDFLLNF